jgi:iron complex outermembrane receptor protein
VPHTRYLSRTLTVWRGNVVAALGVCLLACFLVVSLPRAAAGAEITLSLADLFDLKVEAATRTEVSAMEVPQSVTVITRADIDASPASTLPELLRYTVGANVLEVHSSQNILTTRGSNAFTPAKVLILIDGQKIDPTLFSTTWWELVPIGLGDIERIEFIRTPGTIYGANAQNGVVNIITRAATDDSPDGGELSYSLGDQDFQLLHVGMQKAFETMALRLSFEVFEHDAYSSDSTEEIVPGKPITGGEQTFNDHPEQLELAKLFSSLRIDLGDASLVTTAGYQDIRNIQGRVPDRLCFVGVEGDIGFLNVDYEFEALAMTHSIGLGLNQTHYEFVRNSTPGALAPAEFTQQNYRLRYEGHKDIGDDHHLLAGVEYELEDGRNGGGVPFLTTRTVEYEGTLNIHFQEAWALSDRDRLYVGGMFTDHYLAGASFAPLLAFVHTFDDRHTLRLGMFGSNRNPTIFEHSMDYDQSTGSASKRMVIQSNPDLDPEETRTYEIGIRSQLSDRLYLAATSYLTEVQDGIEWNLTGTRDDGGGANLRPVYRSENSLDQTISGVELEMKFQATAQWAIGADYSYTHVENSSSDPQYQDPNGLGEGRYGDQYVPESIVSGYVAYTGDLLSGKVIYQHTDAHVWQWPSWKAAGDSLSAKQVPSYGLWNATLAVHPRENLTLSLHGQNLLDKLHTEWRGDKSFFGRTLWARIAYTW